MYLNVNTSSILYTSVSCQGPLINERHCRKWKEKGKREKKELSTWYETTSIVPTSNKTRRRHFNFIRFTFSDGSNGMLCMCITKTKGFFFLFLVFHVVLMLNEDNVYSVIVLQNCCHFFFLSFFCSFWFCLWFYRYCGIRSIRNSEHCRWKGTVKGL